MLYTFVQGRKLGSKGPRGNNHSNIQKLSLEHCGGLWSPASLQRTDGAVGSGCGGGAREAGKACVTNFLTTSDSAAAELMCRISLSHLCIVSLMWGCDGFSQVRHRRRSSCWMS